MNLELMVQRPADLTPEEEHDIQVRLDAAIERYKNNEVDLTKLCMECTTLATATESRARQLTEQGFLRRAWNSVLGTNRKLRDLNSRDIACGQYMAQQALSRLAEQNALTMQATIAMGNQVSLVTKRVGDLQANQIKLWKTIGVLAADSWHHLENHSERLLQLEHSDRLKRWNDTLLVSEERGVPYADLPLEAKLVVVLNDFHVVTAGNWDPIEDWKTLREALRKLNVNYRNDTIVPMAFAEKVWAEEALSDRLFRGCIGGLENLESPIYSPPLYGIRKMLSFQNGDRYILEATRTVTGCGEDADGELALALTNQYIHQLTDVDLSVPLTVDEFARAILVGMRCMQEAEETHASPQQAGSEPEEPAVAKLSPPRDIVGEITTVLDEIIACIVLQNEDAMESTGRNPLTGELIRIPMKEAPAKKKAAATEKHTIIPIHKVPLCPLRQVELSQELKAAIRHILESPEGLALLLRLAGRTSEGGGTDSLPEEAMRHALSALGKTVLTPRLKRMLTEAASICDSQPETLDWHLENGGRILLSTLFAGRNNLLSMDAYDQLSFTSMMKEETFLGLLMRFWARALPERNKMAEVFARCNALMRKAPIDEEREAYFEHVWEQHAEGRIARENRS